jgi:hypothetical protein
MYEALPFRVVRGLNFCSQLKTRWSCNFYLVDLSSSMSWASFALATGGGVDGDGNGGGAPRLVVVFDFVLFGAEFFGLARDAFDTVGFVASATLETAGTSPLATAASV